VTVNEARKIIAVMMVSYPNFKPIDTEIMATTWADMLSDYSYEQINVALKAYIRTDTSGFAPSIGQLIGKLQTISNANKELNEMEAWALVSQALKNGYYGAEEEFAKLPEVVQKAVGTPANLRAWAHTDESSIENVVQSNFMRTYRTVVKRESEYAKMPTSIKNLIGGGTNENLLSCNE
jgi:hypothetical protein